MKNVLKVLFLLSFLFFFSFVFDTPSLALRCSLAMYSSCSLIDRIEYRKAHVCVPFLCCEEKRKCRSEVQWTFTDSLKRHFLSLASCMTAFDVSLLFAPICFHFFFSKIGGAR